MSFSQVSEGIIVGHRMSACSNASVPGDMVIRQANLLLIGQHCFLSRVTRQQRGYLMVFVVPML